MSGPTRVCAHETRVLVIVESATHAYADDDMQRSAQARLDGALRPAAKAMAKRAHEAIDHLPTSLRSAFELLPIADDDDPNHVDARRWLTGDLEPQLAPGRPVILRFQLDDVVLEDETTTITAAIRVPSLPDALIVLSLGTILRDAMLAAIDAAPRRGDFTYPRDVPAVDLPGATTTVRALARRQALDEQDLLDLTDALKGAAEALAAVVENDLPRQRGRFAFCVWDDRSQFWVNVRDRAARPEALTQILAAIFPDVVEATATGSCPDGHDGWTLRVDQAT